jgi:hypothetical protein
MSLAEIIHRENFSYRCCSSEESHHQKSFRPLDALPRKRGVNVGEEDFVKS